MRVDSVGMFWQDEVKTGRGTVARMMPAIPDTGWQRPTEYPNLRNARVLAIDTETWDPELVDFKDEDDEAMAGKGPGWARGKGHIVGISVATDDGYKWYFPMRHEVEREWNLDAEHVLNWARDNFCYTSQPKVFANAMYDIGWLEHEGVKVNGEIVDVQIAEALLHEASRVELEILSHKYLGIGKETDTLYTWLANYYGGPIGPKQRANIYRAPPRLVGPYAEVDAVNPILIARCQYPLLVKEGLLNLFQMECELLRLLIKMRFMGVTVDLNKAEQLDSALKAKAKELQKRLNDLAGFEVNVNAADSLAKAFDKFGVTYPRTAPTSKKPNGSPSFQKLFLETVDHPIGTLIRDIRKCTKLAGTFVQSYILESNINGKVYGQYHPVRGDTNGTRSGRYSSSTPNLTNLPSRDEELAPLVRGIFGPDYGHRRWRRKDYSQIEYRFLAHYAIGPGSDELRETYRRDPRTDYHVRTTNTINDITHIGIKRKAAKNINFGLVFGMGEPKLQRSLGLTDQQGSTLFKAYHTGVPYVKKTMAWCSEEAQTTGTITTILGRKSRFDLWEPAKWDGQRYQGLPYNEAIAQYGYRIKRAYTHKALNRRLQGSAADLLKAALFAAWKAGLFDYIGVPRLLVHDELDFSDPGNVDDGFLELQHILETTLQLRVPVLVETECGPDWGHCVPCIIHDPEPGNIKSELVKYREPRLTYPSTGLFS